MLAQALVRMKLVSANQPVTLVPLTGGVSSDVYRVDLPRGPVCIKRALAEAQGRRRLARTGRAESLGSRVDADRGRDRPRAVPEILGEDRETGCFAMAYLPPDRYPVWKALLSEGIVDLPTAAAIGDTLGRIHAATADRPEIAARFPTDDIFFAIRLEPYLVATGRAHADLAPRFDALVEATRSTKRVLVHGDFSPKNMLIGPEGPVILDAECAWYGDPAFDLAFVLNHLLLKGAWRPAWRIRYGEAFLATVTAYFKWVGWEPSAACDARTAALLPGLMLARVDGKSPAEYLTDDAQQDEIRTFARTLLARPVDSVAEIARRWIAGGTQ